nr:hypothetical protein [Tanacetum cinerariifolium]
IPIPTVTQPDTTPIIQYSRRTRIAQSSALPTEADEPSSPVRDDSQREACPTDSGFIADQDRATITKSSTLPRKSAPRVTSPAAEEGSMQQTLNELTAFCTRLQRQHSKLLAKFLAQEAQEEEIVKLKDRVKVLEDKEDVAVTQSGDDAPMKGDQEVKKDVSSLRYIALPNWAHDALLESSSSKPQDHCSTEVPESSRNTNPTASTSNPPADQMETITVESPIPTVSSPVPTACFTDSLKPSSDARLISKRVANQVETPSLDNILTLTNQFEDILGVTTNLDELNGVEADVSNMETTITASPTPTLRIHKDHLDTLIQTRNKSKEVGEQ